MFLKHFVFQRVYYRLLCVVFQSSRYNSQGWYLARCVERLSHVLRQQFLLQAPLVRIPYSVAFPRCSSVIHCDASKGIWYKQEIPEDQIAGCFLNPWQEIINICKLKDASRIIRWCAYDSDFTPKRTDNRFKIWASKGLTNYNPFLCQNQKVFVTPVCGVVISAIWKLLGQKVHETGLFAECF